MLENLLNNSKFVIPVVTITAIIPRFFPLPENNTLTNKVPFNIANKKSDYSLSNEPWVDTFLNYNGNYLNGKFTSVPIINNILTADLIDEISSPILSPKNKFNIKIKVTNIKRGQPSFCNEEELWI